MYFTLAINKPVLQILLKSMLNIACDLRKRVPVQDRDSLQALKKSCLEVFFFQIERFEDWQVEDH